jgi:hypothetical protein
MKRRLTKAEFDALTPELKLMYVAEGADSYILPLTDYIDPGPIERARDRERDDARALREQMVTLNTELTTLRAATPKDVATLTREHNTRISELTATADARILTMRKQHEKTLIDHAAREIATAITGKDTDAAIMLPHTTSRLSVVWDGDNAVLKVKNIDGSDGPAYVEATSKSLQKEFVDNPQFGSIVVKSKASGGGAAGQRIETITSGAGKKFKDMTEKERVALYKADPAEFSRLQAAE